MSHKVQAPIDRWMPDLGQSLSMVAAGQEVISRPVFHVKLCRPLRGSCGPSREIGGAAEEDEIRRSGYADSGSALGGSIHNVAPHLGAPAEWQLRMPAPLS